MGSSRKQSEMEQCVFFLLCIVFLPFLLLIACIGMIMGWTDIKNKKILFTK
jgi:hypothetical protein